MTPPLFFMDSVLLLPALTVRQLFETTDLHWNEEAGFLFSEEVARYEKESDGQILPLLKWPGLHGRILTGKPGFSPWPANLLTASPDQQVTLYGPSAGFSRQVQIITLSPAVWVPEGSGNEGKTAQVSLEEKGSTHHWERLPVVTAPVLLPVILFPGSWKPLIGGCRVTGFNLISAGNQDNLVTFNRLITETDIRHCFLRKKKIRLLPGSRMTPAASDLAKSLAVLVDTNHLM